MNRREFLSGLTGAAAALVLPDAPLSLVEEVKCTDWKPQYRKYGFLIKFTLEDIRSNGVAESHVDAWLEDGAERLRRQLVSQDDRWEVFILQNNWTRFVEEVCYVKARLIDVTGKNKPAPARVDVTGFGPPRDARVSWLPEGSQYPVA